MGFLHLPQGVCLGVSMTILLSFSLCYAKHLYVAGSIECADCTPDSVKTWHPTSSGARMTIGCKFTDGSLRTLAEGDIDAKGNFEINFLDYEILKNGIQEKKCFLKLNGASGAPCPVQKANGILIVIFNSTHNAKQTSAITRRLKFPSKSCSLAISWPSNKDNQGLSPSPGKLTGHIAVLSPSLTTYMKPLLPKAPLSKNFVQSPVLVSRKLLTLPFKFFPPGFPLGPIIQYPSPTFDPVGNPLPPIVPIPNKPLPPSTPNYKKPLPPVSPTYKKPTPPTPYIGKPSPPLDPNYKNPLPPPSPSFKKLPPQPAPYVKKPSPPLAPTNTIPHPPPIPELKKPLPPPTPYTEKPSPPLAPTYAKPQPPPIPEFKKPLPPMAAPPMHNNPLLPPLAPIHRKPLPVPPSVPIYKNPLPPPAPTYQKHLPPPADSPKPITQKPYPPPVPKYEKSTPPFHSPKPAEQPNSPVNPPMTQSPASLPSPKPSVKKPAPSPTSILKPPAPASPGNSFSPIPRAPPIPKLPPIPTIPRRYFNSPKSRSQPPTPPTQFPHEQERIGEKG